MNQLVNAVIPKQAQKLLEQGTPFFDVREVEEFAQTRIPGATLLPLSELAERYSELPTNQTVVLYCRSGNRSAQAVGWLASQGYKNLINLEGGVLEWYRQGLLLDTKPIEETYHASHYRDLTPHQAETWLKEGAHVVDVREPYEYAAGHVPGAQNIPLGQFTSQALALPKDRKIVLVCASGGRSSAAAEYLLGQGFQSDLVANLEGGTYGWMSAGFGVER